MVSKALCSRQENRGGCKMLLIIPDATAIPALHWAEPASGYRSICRRAWCLWVAAGVDKARTTPSGPCHHNNAEAGGIHRARGGFFAVGDMIYCKRSSPFSVVSV